MDLTGMGLGVTTLLYTNYSRLQKNGLLSEDEATTFHKLEW